MKLQIIEHANGDVEYLAKHGELWHAGFVKSGERGTKYDRLVRRMVETGKAAHDLKDHDGEA